MSDYKCPHCEYYMWQGKEFYECKLEQENAELKAYKDVNEDFKTAWEELAEKFLTLNGKSYSYYLTLQEIKAIAEAPKPFIDFSETKTAIEVEYDYSAIYNELELRLHKVLELVTKAEEECAI